MKLFRRKPRENSISSSNSIQNHFGLRSQRTNRKPRMNRNADFGIQQQKKAKREEERKSGNELTFQDLRFNFWPIKLLTVLKILPTEMNMNSGKLGKKEHEKFLDKFLYGLWNIFAVVRIISIVLNIIYLRIISLESKQDESDQDRDVEINRFLLTVMITVLAICVYFGLYKSVMLQTSTFTVLVNDLLRNLRKPHQIQIQCHSKDEINWAVRIKNFLSSLLKRPFQINLLIYLPFLIYSVFFAILVLAILDHNLPVFLISFALKSNMSSTTHKIFLYSILAVLDCVFYFHIVSLTYYGIHDLLLGIVAIRQNTRKAVEQLKSPNGLEEARKSLQLIKTVLLLYNLVGSTVVYMAKIIQLMAAVIGGFGAIKMMNSSPLFTTIYFFFFVIAVLVHTSLFDRVYRIPEEMEELKEKIIIRAQNTNFRDERKKKEYQKFCGSVQRLGIQAGGFYVMERETTLIFGGFVSQKIVDLLLTFK